MSKGLIDPIEYEKYDKIVDTIYTLGMNCVLRFNVSLSRGYNDKRYHFYKEFEYGSKYGDGPQTLVTIKRDYDYYLSIENNIKPDNTNKCFIRIGATEYYLFKNAIETVISWFIDSKYKDLFQMKNNELIVVAPAPHFRLNGFPMDKYLSFDPVVSQKGQSKFDCEPGVKIELSDPNNIVIMNLDKLMGLSYILSSFNMIQSAQIMINYLGRPEFGTNRYVMETGRTYDAIHDQVMGVDGRKIPGTI